MSGGAVEYRRGDCIRPWRRKIDEDKARGIVGLAVQMCRVAERGNEYIPRIVRLAHRYRNLARAEFTSRLEPIKFYKFPICLASGRLRFIIARTAKFLPHEQFALEFYYRLKFYAAARDLNFAAMTSARSRFGSAKFTPRSNSPYESKTLPLDR